MKTAVYIEDGKTQLVLTPETDFETRVVHQLDTARYDVKMHMGSFYECEGGWMREGSDDESLIIVIEKRK